MDKRLKNRHFGYATPENMGWVNMCDHQQMSGYSVGIIYIEDVFYPMVPGNVVNAYTYDFPVRMRGVPNLDIDRLFRADPTIADDIIELGKYMIEKGIKGSIINTASMSAHIVNVPQPQCAYNASKAGVIQLTKSLAIEWADKGVRVNCISPGYIGTELVKTNPTLIPLIETWNKMAPMHRLGDPEELQTVTLFLASDASSFTTGSDVVVDGAFTCF